MKIILTIGCILLLIIGCNFTKTYINRDSDKKTATDIIDTFFSYVRSKDYNKVYKLFSEGNKNITAIERNHILGSLLARADIQLGTVGLIKLIKCETKVIEGDKSYGEYNLIYHVTRNGNVYQDTFKLLLEDQKIRIRIIDYDIKPVLKD